jgi:hypothetical protein
MSVTYGRSVGYSPQGTGVWAGDYSLTSIDTTNFIASYEHWQYGDRGYTIEYDASTGDNILKVNTDNNVSTPFTVNGSATATIVSGTSVDLENFVYTIAADDLWFSSSAGGGGDPPSTGGGNSSSKKVFCNFW